MFRILNYQIINPKKTSVLIAAALLVAGGIAGAALYLNSQIPDFGDQAQLQDQKQFLQSLQKSNRFFTPDSQELQTRASAASFETA